LPFPSCALCLPDARRRPHDVTDFREQVQASLGTAYTIERELGGGGMSRVFVAHDATLRRAVVVKVLPPDLVAGVNVERFRREILVAAGLQHPHIVPVLSSGDVDGLPWFTMPFVQGESLRERIARGPVPIAEVTSILREVAKALAYAHEHGVVHRDIKPDNVLLSGGTAVVTDFGIAKALAAAASGAPGDNDRTTGQLTGLGMSIGTPMYMAPEQAAADPNIDARADIYSFGCMAYELLAGRPPFSGLSPQRLLAAHMGEHPRPVRELRPDTPPLLADLVMHCLEKEANRRPGTAADLVRLIDAASTTSGNSSVAAALLSGGRVRLGVALALWTLAFLAAWLLAKAAVVVIGLPSWVVPGALIVAALGLPVILLTAYVQRTAYRVATRTPTLTPGGSHMPASTFATMAMRASPHVSWKRTTRGGIAAFTVFAASVGVFMGMRAFGIGPAGSLVGAGVMGERDAMLIADFSTSGGDSLLARAVTEAIRTDLGQSNALRLLPASVVNQTLGLMRKTPGTHVDTGIARVIAVRTGAKAVLGGDVAPLGASYLLTARLIAPSSGDVLAAFRETASDSRDLVPAVERLSRALRAKVGESLKRIHAEPPLTQVTTSSLDALRLYAQGLHVGDDVGDVPGGTALLLQAVQRDSTFAGAWRKLGVWANNAGDARAESYAKRAADNAGHLTEGEGYTATASYMTTLGDGFDPRGSIVANRKAVAVDSTNTTALVNAAIQYGSLGSLDSAIALARRADQTNAYALYHLVTLTAEAGRFAESDSLRAEAHQRAPGFPYRRAFDFVPLYMRGRYDSAASVLAGSRVRRYERLQAHLEMTLGQYARARVTLQHSIDSAAASGDSAVALDAVATRSLIESLGRNDPGAALAELQDGERRFPIARLPVSRRPYYQLAAAYAAAGRPDRAAQLIEEGGRQYSRGVALWYHESEMIAKGLLALAVGKPRDAVAALSAPVYCGGTSPRTIGQNATFRCPEPFLAEAQDRAGNAEAARTTYEHYVNTHLAPAVTTDGIMLAQSLRRLGELYEAKGDKQSAAKYYVRLIELWKNVDPEMKPQVAEMAKRVARLGVDGR
jgi:tetratricopeptide (TPR) repeat protein